MRQEHEEPVWSHFCLALTPDMLSLAAADPSY